jgi:outer membrane PBP1 activator LpoA protein
MFIVPNKFVRCIFVFAASAVFLSGCAVAPDPVGEREPTSAPVTQLQPSDTSIQEHLNAAKRTTVAHERYENLVSAATLMLDAGEVNRAGVLLSLINAQQLRPMPANQLELQKARFAAELHNWQRVLELTEGLDTQFNQRQQRAQIFQLRYQAFYQQQQFLEAAYARIQESRYLAEPDAALVWDALTYVPASFWRQGGVERDELTRGWAALLQRITLATDHQQSMSSAIAAWQRAYPNHPAQTVAETLLNDITFTQPAEQIAVLLPLSGSLASSGIAVRNGILAALHTDSRTNVVFFDTAQLSLAEIHQQLANSHVDVLVGPLDRNAIEQFIAAGANNAPLVDVTDMPAREPRQWQQLWLNQAPAQHEPGPRDAFFALDSESEAETSVRWLASKGHRNVLFLGPDTQRGRGTAIRLEHWWRDQYGPQNVQSWFYTSSGDMVEVVQQALHVEQSSARIDRTERLVNSDRSLQNDRRQSPELHHVVRSRQDIDAIYLLGDANQVRLLKPYIDVNLSAFGRRIPVYASSLVHEEQRSRGENDLDGVFFSDAPFTLQHDLQAELKNQLSSAMQPWSLNRQRLVAMGYDAMQLASKLSVMQRIPGYSHAGLTGLLRISTNTVERELDWAKFDGHEIKLEHSSVINASSRN